MSGWFDDRDEQMSLLGDEEATRTDHREGQTVTGSEAFADDRDRNEESITEQAGLFQQEEELDGQASLTGGTASRTESSGFFDGGDGNGNGFDFGFEDFGPTSRTPVATEEFDDDIVVDVNGGRDKRQFAGTGLSPEDFELDFSTSFRTAEDRGMSDGSVIAEDLAEVQTEESRRQRIEGIEANISMAESEGVLTPDGPNGDAEHAPDDLFRPNGNGGRNGGRRQTTEIEFGSRAAANAAREAISEGASTGRYDGRHKTIEVDDGKISERQLNRLSRRAADSRRAEAEKAGQRQLTEAEKDRLDFSEISVVETRSIKGVMQSEGVDDWTSFVDPTLSVEEHRSIAERASRDEIGARMDDTETEADRIGREADAFAAEQRGLEDHAIKGAKAGEQEAINVLVDELGWDRTQAKSLAQATDDPRERKQIVETAIMRAKSHGRFMTEPVPAPNSPGMRKATTGRYVGNDFEDAQVGRLRKSGQFTRI